MDGDALNSAPCWGLMERWNTPPLVSFLSSFSLFILFPNSAAFSSGFDLWGRGVQLLRVLCPQVLCGVTQDQKKRKN